MSTSYPVVYAAKADDEARRESASGGAFTNLYEAAISRGGVVYGCAFDEKLRAIHVRCTTLEECKRCRGSKYSQSDMGECYSEALTDLRDGRFVLFTGTPCQIAGIKKLTNNPENLLTVEIICHGAPSPMLFQQYLRYVSAKRNKKLVGYEHRPKNRGWRHSERAIFEVGEECDTPLLETWKRLFYSNMFLRPSCEKCPFAKMPRVADITIGDYWGIQDTSIADYRDDLGVSVILINSEKGTSFFESLEMDCRHSTFEEAVRKNPNLVGPSPIPMGRNEAWSYYRAHGFNKLVDHYKFHRTLPRWVASKIKGRISKIVRHQ